MTEPTVIQNGMTGAVARAAINENFSAGFAACEGLDNRVKVLEEADTEETSHVGGYATYTSWVLPNLGQTRTITMDSGFTLHNTEKPYLGMPVFGRMYNSYTGFEYISGMPNVHIRNPFSS